MRLRGVGIVRVWAAGGASACVQQLHAYGTDLAKSLHALQSKSHARSTLLMDT